MEKGTKDTLEKPKTQPRGATDTTEASDTRISC